MRWIGLTGGIASGKSTVSARLRAMGFRVVDADQISHELTAPGGEAIAPILAQFGADLLERDGRLNRQKLGTLVFGRRERLQQLEAILHPLIQKRVAHEKVQFEKLGCKVAFYDVPLLFEKNMQTHFGAVILVTSTKDQQILRLQQRSGLTLEEVEARLNHQMPLSEKELKTPYVIHNYKDLAFLEKEIDRVLRELKIL